MPGRKYSTTNGYRYGFNGKEQDKETTGTSTYDYGFRIYNSTLGRFLSVDPLQTKFPSLTPYAFSGCSPIALVDLDGREPVETNPNTETLVILVAGYVAEPFGGFTQVGNLLNYYQDRYKTALKNGISWQVEEATNYIQAYSNDGALQGGILSVNPEKTVVGVFASSTGDITKNDIITSIKNFKRNNPNGKVVVVGHSAGGDNLIEIAKENKKDITFDLLITLDSKDAQKISVDDNNIYKNVKNAIGYYSDNKFDLISGEKLDFKDKETNGVNILSPGSNHRSIDNNLTPYLIQDINNYTSGKDAPKIAKNRKLPTFVPKNDGTQEPATLIQ